MRNHQNKYHNRQEQSPGDREKEKKIKCGFCPKSFNSLVIAKHHETSCEEKSKNIDKEKGRQFFECKICLKVFGYKPNLLAHQKTIHGLAVGQLRKKFPCKYCSEVFKGKIRLSKHITSCHPDASGELCDLCGKSFPTEDRLLRHTAIHTSRVRELQCSFCPKKFFRKDVLHVHEKVHTNPLICTHCGKKFPEKRYLETHILKLHSAKKFECPYCLKGYSTAELLKKHLTVHDKVLEHQCSHCSKRFKTKQEVKRHLLLHMAAGPNSLPLKCDTCHKGFLSESKLQSHIDKVHTKTSKLLMYCQHCELVNNVTAEFNAIYNLSKLVGSCGLFQFPNLQRCEQNVPRTCMNGMDGTRKEGGGSGSIQ